MALKLGVNIDHVATLRQVRYAAMPASPNREPVLADAAAEAEMAGADSITIHLREDRRHIQDDDVLAVRERIGVPLNLEIGNTAEIVAIAVATRPDYVCLVPENRQEITTEGGLDVAGQKAELSVTIRRLQDAGIEVSLFIDPDPGQVRASADAGAEMVELHTGAFANTWHTDAELGQRELARLVESARASHQAGLQVNAGHGLTVENLPSLYEVPHVVELNIGHHIVSRAVFIGLTGAIAEVRAVMDGYPG